MEKGFDNRGISQVVTAVIIILLVLVVAGIIAVLVFNLANKSGQETEQSIDCFNTRVTVNSVEKVDTNEDTVADAYEISLTQASDIEEPISQVVLIFSNDKSQSQQINRGISLGTLESTKLIISFSEIDDVDSNAKKVQVIPVIGEDFCDQNTPFILPFLSTQEVSDLGIILGGPEQINYGEQTKYNLTATNYGPSSASEVSVQLFFPEFVGTVLSGLPTQCSFSTSSKIVNCNIPALGNQQSFSFLVQVSSASSGEEGFQTAIASVSSLSYDPHLSDNSYSKVTGVENQNPGGSGNGNGDETPTPTIVTCATVPIDIYYANKQTSASEVFLSAAGQDGYQLVLSRGDDNGPATLEYQLVFADATASYDLTADSTIDAFIDYVIDMGGSAPTPEEEQEYRDAIRLTYFSVNKSSTVNVLFPVDILNVTAPGFVPTSISVVPLLSGQLCSASDSASIGGFLNGVSGEVGGECSLAGDWLSVIAAIPGTQLWETTGFLSNSDTLMLDYVEVTVQRGLGGGPNREVYYNVILSDGTTGKVFTAEEIQSNYLVTQESLVDDFGLLPGEEKSVKVFYDASLFSGPVTSVRIVPLLNGEVCEEQIPDAATSFFPVATGSIIIPISSAAQDGFLTHSVPSSGAVSCDITGSGQTNIVSHMGVNYIGSRDVSFYEFDTSVFDESAFVPQRIDLELYSIDVYSDNQDGHTAPLELVSISAINNRCDVSATDAERNDLYYEIGSSPALMTTFEYENIELLNSFRDAFFNQLDEESFTIGLRIYVTPYEYIVENDTEVIVNEYTQYEFGTIDSGNPAQLRVYYSPIVVDSSPGFDCTSVTYSECPAECVATCIPISCSTDPDTGEITCTSDCDGAGSCSSP